jgi:hypothetical protein
MGYSQWLPLMTVNSMVPRPSSRLLLMYGELIQNQNIVFFTWLVLHNKALTVGNMAKRNWP